MLVDMVIAVHLLRVILASICMAELAEPQPQRRAVVVDIRQLNTILPDKGSLTTSLQLTPVSNCISKPGAFKQTITTPYTSKINLKQHTAHHMNAVGRVLMGRGQVIVSRAVEQQGLNGTA
jgi:hypothetical protein